MPNCEELLAKAQNNPAGLRFTELCVLAECFGWRLARTAGSHHVYKRARTMQVMNFQNVKGKAKPYQIKQLLDVLDALSSE